MYQLSANGQFFLQEYVNTQYSLKCGRRCAIVEIQIFIRKTQV